MYRENVFVKCLDDIQARLNYETVAVSRTLGCNYYYNCNLCKRNVPADDSGTQYDCINCVEFEGEKTTRSGRCKIYCLNYERRKEK